MKKELEGIEFVTNIDLIGEIWENRPQAVLSKAFILDEKYTGKSAKEKIQEAIMSFWNALEKEVFILPTK